MQNSNDNGETKISTTGSPKMKIKHILMLAYGGIAVLFALYGYFFGDLSYKSFAFHVGRSLVWPAVMFPGLGAFLGSVILVAFIALVVMS